MNNIRHNLKIELNGKTILKSRNAEQKIVPLEQIKIKRNVNSEPIIPDQSTKYKCLIETTDAPDMSILESGKEFHIYSILKMKEAGTDKPSSPFVPDSVEKRDGYIEFCPILKMFLTNFKYKSSSNLWSLEFEEK